MIVRVNRSLWFDGSTVGTMKFPSGLELRTLERPWKNNEAFVSCIPEGDYVLEWDQTGRIKGVPRLRGTEPRTQINIHSANYVYELMGCIAVGLSVSLDSELTTPVLEKSIKAMKLLVEQLGEPGKDGEPILVNGNPVILKIEARKAG